MDIKVPAAALLLLCMAFSFACSGGSGGESSPAESAAPALTSAADPTQQAAAYETGAPAQTQEAIVDFDFPDYSSFRGFDGNSTNIFETEDSIYICSQGWVYFSDKEYKDWMPLCPRPDCKHDTEDCGAYIGTGSIQYGDGYIYYMEGTGFDASALKYPVLCRMKLDGNGHERIAEIPQLQPRDESFHPYSNRWDCFASNKYFFLRGVFYDFGEDGGMPGTEVHTYAVDMQNGSITKLFEGLDDPDLGKCFAMLEGRGSKLYGQMLYSDYGGVNTIVELDLESGEVKELCEFAPQLRTLEEVSYLKDDALYFIDFDLPNDKKTLYRLELDTCELTELKQASIKNSHWKVHDGYANLYYGIGSNKLKPAERGFYISNEDYEIVSFVAYADYPEVYWQYYGDLLSVYNEQYSETREEPDLLITLSYITKDYIFGCGPDVDGELVEAYRENPGILLIYNPTGGIPLWYLDKKDIGSDSLMWKKWEP